MKTTRIAAVALVLLAGAGPAFAMQLPPGRWWDRPRLAEELKLTGEQKSKLEQVTIESARRMIDLKAAVDRAELDLRALSDREPFDPRAVRAAFAALQEARMRLESERFELLLKSREVLTSEQWQRIRELLRERRRADGPEDRPGMPDRQGPPDRMRRPPIND